MTWRTRMLGGRRQGVAALVFGMSGLRLDRARSGKPFAIWALIWVLCALAFHAVFEHGWWLDAGDQIRICAWVYAGSVWTAYYVVLLGGVLGGPGRRVLMRRWGEAGAYSRYEAVLGVVFLNQGLCQVAVMKAYAETGFAFVPPGALGLIGGTMMAVGFGWKAWATHEAGMDTYYYKDMFLGRATVGGEREPWVATGPYRVTANPMYGLGNLQAYGAAVWHGSWPGLIVAFLFQASIYLFYFGFERRFIRRIYRSD